MAQHQSSGYDRRSSRLQSPARASSMENHDEDEYDLDAMAMSDGFANYRPSGQNRASYQTPLAQPIPSTTRRSIPPPRPSSMTKPRIDNFALRHDGDTASSSNGRSSSPSPSSSSRHISRASSASTENPFIRPESPYSGPVAPSHPYQLYPQDARLARTASVATTSTYQHAPERQYSGATRPAHPYGMYPQNTTAEAESESTPQVIPVGFPGRRDDYRRRLGPDGEEIADIIGPDGHTEQLPPYSQYPDEAFARKNRLPAVIPQGAGGIGLATRNPEFASDEDLAFPASPLSVRSQSPSGEHQVTITPQGVSEKPVEKRWKTVARRKICGIVPVWFIVIIGALLCTFAITLGSVLAVIRNKLKQGHDPFAPHAGTSSNPSAAPTGYITVTTTFDATPVASVPTGLPALPEGIFGLHLPVPSTASQTCISESALFRAWNCIMPFPQLQMNVSPVSNASEFADQQITIIRPDSMDPSGPPPVLYGTQPPIISVPKILSLVNDSNVVRFGPAWFFQTQYDKLVIVPEAMLTPSSLTKRGHGHEMDMSFPRNRHIVAQSGDRPWYCYWNGTILGTFIYPNASSGAGASSVTYGSNIPSSTPPVASSGAGSIGSTINLGSTITTSAPPTASASASASGPPIFEPMPPYPKLVRMEERRVTGTTGNEASAAQPYCVKMQILNNGLASPIPDPTTGAIQSFLINETETDTGGALSKRVFELIERDDQACNCVWFSS